MYSHDCTTCLGAQLTDLVELKGVEFGAGLGQKLLGGLAVGAVGLREDGCSEVSRAAETCREGGMSYQRRSGR